MNIKDVVSCSQKSDRYNQYKEAKDGKGMNVYTKNNGLYRSEVINDELTSKLNKAFGCRTRYLVTNAHQYGYTRFHADHHIVYHLSPCKTLLYVTRMVVKKDRYLVPRFHSFFVKTGRYGPRELTTLPDDDASIIQNVHKVIKELLLGSPHYRLFHVTGEIS